MWRCSRPLRRASGLGPRREATLDRPNRAQNHRPTVAGATAVPKDASPIAEHVSSALPAAQVEHFRAVQGNRIEKHVQTAAVEVIAAFQVYSAAGMVAGAGDQHLIAEAQHLVAEGAP